MNEAEFKDMIEDSPFAGSPVKPIMLKENATLQFRCHRNVKCWNACCSNIDIPLTPYDVLRLKKRLDMSSGEFLNQYSVPFEMDKDGMPGIKLKPVEGGTACQFMTPEGCGVYEDRPTACRYYPVALLTMRRSDEYVDRSAYALVKEPHCLGHFEDKKQTIEEYRREQGVEEYDQKAHAWRQLVIKRKSAGPAIGKPTPVSNQMIDRDPGSNFDLVPIASDVPEATARVLSEDPLDFPGVHVTMAARRAYPYGPLLSQLMGYTGAIDPTALAALQGQGYQPNDVIGQAGLEQRYESDLRGTYGLQQVEEDATGQPVQTLAETRQPVAGDSLQLSIDVAIQQQAQEALSWGLRAAGLHSGVLAVMNPQTGERSEER